MVAGLDALLTPISADSPCGENLEDTQLLSSFDAFRVFGQGMPLGDTVEWRDLKTLSESALQKSKDLRLLSHLAACLIRLDSLAAFVAALEVANGWLETYWDAVYPRMAEDAIARKFALAALADRMAILDALRRAPLVTNRQLGSCSLRDIEIAAGALQLGADKDKAAPLSEAQIDALFAAAPLEELTALEALLDLGVAALAAIGKRMRDASGVEGAPDLDPLEKMLKKIKVSLAKHLDPRRAASAEAAGEGSAAGGEAAGRGGAVAIGGIRSRQDAVRALDAVGEFFRRNEPSSPVPLFAERTKRLISMDFLALLGEIAPDSVSIAKRSAGVRDE